MKEFSIAIDKQLTKGIKPYVNSYRNALFLSEAVNLISSQEGLIPYESVMLPIPISTLNAYGIVDETFPFPQLFICKQAVFLLCSNRIFYINPDDWTTLHQLTTYDVESITTEKAIATGGCWEVIDFWDTILFTNGVCTLILSNKDVMLGNDFKIYAFDRTPISCGTAHKGRAILGGFEPSSFWGSTWTSFINNWKESQVEVGIDYDVIIQGTSQLAALKENWVWWSSIGGGDLLMLFFPTLGLSGITESSYGSTRPFIFDILLKNEQGSAPMFSQGKVQAIRPLGDWVIVYSDEGVQAMRPVVGPAPTYQQVNLHLGGIASRGAVAGDDKTHVYVDKSGCLVKIDDKLGVYPLGYRAQFYPMLGKDIIVSHSSEPQALGSMGRFYISSGYESYIYTEAGLSKTTQWVSSASYFQGTTVGVGKQILAPEEMEGSFCTDVIDFNQSGLKTIEWVRIGGNETVWLEEDGIQLQVAIEYQFRIANDLQWAKTGYKTVNNEGVVFFPATGIAFKIKVRVTNYTKLEVNYVEVGFKLTDRRYTRGVQVNTLG